MASQRSTSIYCYRLLLLGIGSVLVLIRVADLSLRDSGALVSRSRHPFQVLVNDVATDSVDAQDDNTYDNGSMPFHPLPGKWVHVGTNRTFAAPVCCGWDKGEWKHHEWECGNQVSNKEFYRGPPATNGYYQQTGGMACHPESDKRAKFIDEWEWQSPELPSFDANATCRQLQNRE